VPSYEMLTEFEFLDVNGTKEFEPSEEIYYWEPDGKRVNEGYCRNFLVDYKNGLVSFANLWQGPAIDHQPYRVVSATESWYMLEGEVTLTNVKTGKKLTAGPGQVVTVKRGEELIVDATAFRVIFTCLNMPEKDMGKMTAQDSEFQLPPIPGDGPTGEGPQTVRDA
jgi:hypothetical protein